MSSFLTRASKTALALALGIGMLLPASVAQAAPVGAVARTVESAPTPTPDDESAPESPPADPAAPEASTDADGAGAAPETQVQAPPIPDDAQAGTGTSPQADDKPLIPMLDPNENWNVDIPQILAAIPAGALPSDGFAPGFIISDGHMYHGGSMTAAQIQRLLEREVPRCKIGDPGKEAGKPIYGSKVADTCLRGLTTKTESRAANAYCTAYAGSARETAAQIIAKVGRACGVSPKVLLVRLQLEQSLISDAWPTVRQFSYAMGWNCPDSGPGNSANCNNGTAGFLDQVYGSAWQIKRYQARPSEYNYHAFRNNTIKWHPNAGCGTSSVYISNQATAALYIYTPYRPNAAALNAGWGEGDACSSYGNRNFYQYYRAWFGSPKTRYGDIPTSHAFYKHIEWMGARGYAASGADAPAFNPANATTRGAMATFLRRMIEPGYTPSANLKLPYADVPKSNPHYAGIAWMYERGYAAKAAKFNPGSSTTRGAMATFLYRLEDGAKDGVTAKPPYTDVPADSTHAKGIAWMAKQGYAAAGPSNPEFRPADPVSRGAMAAFLYRIYA
ncbi:hypothetical protein D3248_12750 [Leucobacter zeae]|nr:hypothetical protein [Leucobacter zeae]